ncbi:MAG: hypothetical protein ABI947_02540 [Chloroflexota bacterium]
MDQSSVILSVSTILLGLLAAVLAGGSLSLVGFVIVVRHIRNDKQTSELIEKLYMSSPVTFQAKVREGVDIVHEVVQAASETVDLVDVLTDGKLESAS